MSKLSGWMFLLIALVWLLPLIGVVIGSQAVHSWIAVIALAIVGINKVMNK
jgi:uncharacterized membrane protein